MSRTQIVPLALALVWPLPACDAETDASPGAEGGVVDARAGDGDGDGDQAPGDSDDGSVAADASLDGGLPNATDAGDDDAGQGSLRCGTPRTFETGKTPSVRIHVATTGSDAPGCGTASAPCASLGHAAELATPGTAVVMHAGTYPGGGSIEGPRGTDAAPIWIGGAEGEQRPLIDGGGQAFQLSGARYVIVHDLEIANSTQNGINADDGGHYDDAEAARFVVFRDLAIHDVGGSGNQDCLKLSGIHDYWVLDSDFARCGGGGSGSAIDHVGCHRGLIRGNHFQDLGEAGNAVQCKGGSTDIEVRANRFENAGQRGVNLGGSTGFEFFRPPLSAAAANAEARDIRVIANTFRGGVTPVAFVGCVDCLVANNVIASPERWVVRVLQETVTTGEYVFMPASDGTFANNIIYFEGQVGTAVNVGPDTVADSFVFANNLWYRFDSPADSTPPGGLPSPESGAIIGEDPRFADADNGDFRVDPLGPASGAGTAVLDLGGDMEGACFGDPPSIGAYEARRN